MGAGRFIKTPGWDMYSDELVDEDDVLYEVNSDLDIDPELLVYFPPGSDDEIYSDEEDPDDPDFENNSDLDSYDSDLDDAEELDNSMEEDELGQIQDELLELDDEDDSLDFNFQLFHESMEDESDSDS